MRNQEGDQNEEVKTYYRGGARDQMAKACRRLTAGERAMSHNKMKMGRGGKIKNVGCTEGSTPRIEYHARNKEKILSRAVVTLGSLHDQRRQRGGEWREGGASRGANRPEVYRVVLNVNAGILKLGRRQNSVVGPGTSSDQVYGR